MLSDAGEASLTPIQIAQEFATSLDQNPISHSVWLSIRGEPGNYAKNEHGELIPEIKIAIRPRFRHKFGEIPNEYKGVSVCEVPWPKGQ